MTAVTPPSGGGSGDDPPGLRRLKRVTLALGASTALVLAIVLGWLLHGWLGDDEVVVSVDRPVQVYAPETVVAGRIPNVIGLTEDDARRALSDAGVELSAVSTDELEYVGPAGLVVRQSPASGRKIGKGRIRLEISTPARMPDIDGSSEAEARSALSALGARIAVVAQYQPGASEGTVLSTDPPPGEPVADRATLHVAEPLSSVFLNQLEPISSTCRTGEDAIVAGATQAEAIVCQPQHGARPRGVTYTLGGGVESFKAEIGLDDGGDPDVPVAFRVYTDGELALSRRLEFGDSTSISVPLLDRFQLTLEAVAAGVTEPGSLPVRAAFGEPRLVGSRSAIDRLSEGLVE